MNVNKKLGVNEMFYTWQGEGVHMGRAAFFIRLHGCSLHCPWCDSAGTWHKDFVPAGVTQWHPQDLAEYVSKLLRGDKGPFIVITGGEPTMYDLRLLCDEFHKLGYKVHLETSGAFEIQGKFDWITLSPKWAKHPLPENLLSADELKIIVEEEASVVKWWPIIAPFWNKCAVWLHPEWSVHNDLLVLTAISDAVKENPTIFRAGWQLHKNYKVDLLDPGSDKRLIPLGGDLKRGF